MFEHAPHIAAVLNSYTPGPISPSALVFKIFKCHNAKYLVLIGVPVLFDGKPRGFIVLTSPSDHNNKYARPIMMAVPNLTKQA